MALEGPSAPAKPWPALLSGEAHSPRYPAIRRRCRSRAAPWPECSLTSSASATNSTPASGLSISRVEPLRGGRFHDALRSPDAVVMPTFRKLPHWRGIFLTSPSELELLYLNLMLLAPPERLSRCPCLMVLLSFRHVSICHHYATSS